MKNQYTGDVDDFCKYGLLRALTEHGQRRATVAWMLTPDDDSADGRKLGYLNSPNRWRWRDPELFDALRLIVSGGQPRTVAAFRTSGVVFLLVAQPTGRRRNETMTVDAGARATVCLRRIASVIAGPVIDVIGGLASMSGLTYHSCQRTQARLWRGCTAK